MPVARDPSIDHRPPPDCGGFILGGRWRISPQTNRVFDGEVEHQIPDKFMQVLMVLIERPGVVSRRELFDAVWPETVVVEESLTRVISGLRKLFDDDPSSPRVIETIPKKGYRLLARVEKITTDPAAPERRAEAPNRTARARILWPVLAVVAVLIATATWWNDFRTESRRTLQPVQLRLTSLPGIEEYPTLSRAGDRLAFVWDGGDQEPDGVFVAVIDAGPPLRLTDTPGHYAFPAWTHDSRFIAYARVTGPSPGIFMVPSTGGAEIELAAAGSGEVLQTPTFSPDGRWFMFARRDPETGQLQLLRRDLTSGRTDSFAPSASFAYGGFRPRFAPDGRHLAFFRVDGERWDIVITTPDGADVRSVPTGDHPISDFDWTPDGDGLVLCSGDSVRLVGLDGATRRVLATPRSTGTLSLAVDKPLLAFSEGRQEKNIWVWTPASGPAADGTMTRLTQSTTRDFAPTLSPDRRSIAFLSDRSGKVQLWIASAEGRNPRKLTSLANVLEAQPAWAPDGGRVAVTTEVDGVPRTCIVDVVSSQALLLAPVPGGEARPNWSRDGAWLYVSRGAPEGSEIWKRPTWDDATVDAVQITHDGGFRAVESPDGKAVLFTRTFRSTEGIWRSEPDGRNPRLAAPFAGGLLLTWQISDSGLIVGFKRKPDDHTYRVATLDPGSAVTTDLFTFPSRLTFVLDVDPVDGRIFFDRTEAIESDIVAIENY